MAFPWGSVPLKPSSLVESKADSNSFIRIPKHKFWEPKTFSWNTSGTWSSQVGRQPCQCMLFAQLLPASSCNGAAEPGLAKPATRETVASEDAGPCCADHGGLPEDVCTKCHPEVEAKHKIETCPKGRKLPRRFRSEKPRRAESVLPSFIRCRAASPNTRAAARRWPARRACSPRGPSPPGRSRSIRSSSPGRAGR